MDCVGCAIETRATQEPGGPGGKSGGKAGKSRRPRGAWRLLRGSALVLLALYGTLHLASTAYYGLRSGPSTAHPRPETPLPAASQPVASALTRILAEDGVRDAERWAEAIVRASPTDDLGYVALVAAQIRRESHFLSSDLEWLFQRLVPDLVHEMGVPDPVNTVGPMQVQRWSLRGIFERTAGRELDFHDVKELAYNLETGVAACVAHLDPIVTDYYPDRHLSGWKDSYGPVGLTPAHHGVLGAEWAGTLAPERATRALFQKMLSDLTGSPLALDGLLGEHTREVAELLAARMEPARGADYVADLARDIESPAGFASSPTCTVVRTLWSEAFGTPPPSGIDPRIAHDPRLAFVCADFNAGRDSARIAALQALMNDLLGTGLTVDGKSGPLTRAAMTELFTRHVTDPERRADFLDLLERGDKPRWVREKALDLARDLWRAKHGAEPPAALVPDLWHGGFAQELKGIGRINVEGYVTGSIAVYEDYYLRLLTYTGWAWPTDGGPRPLQFL